MNGKAPFRCTKCGKVSYHDVQHLSERPLDNVTIAEGFNCKYCGAWEPVFFKTTSLCENILRLNKIPVHTRKFEMLMAKTITKANNLMQRYKGEFSDGESKYSNLATS